MGKVTVARPMEKKDKHVQLHQEVNGRATNERLTIHLQWAEFPWKDPSGALVKTGGMQMWQMWQGYGMPMNQQCNH